MKKKRSQKDKKRYEEEIQAKFIEKSIIREMRDINAELIEIAEELGNIRRDIDGNR